LRVEKETNLLMIQSAAEFVDDLDLDDYSTSDILSVQDSEPNSDGPEKGSHSLLLTTEGSEGGSGNQTKCYGTIMNMDLK
jgi:hypothetical protein